MNETSTAAIPEQINAQLLAMLKQWLENGTSCSEADFHSAPFLGCYCKTCTMVRETRELIAKATGASQP